MIDNKDKDSIPKEESLKRDTQEINSLSQAIQPFYALPSNCQWKEITQELLNSEVITSSQKKKIMDNQRQLFVFSYPSDGLKIIGLVSIASKAQNPSTIVVLRGGNRLFGLQNPANDLFTTGWDTVISTCYRDGVSEGVDEFGGNDVNDVNHLIKYIPEIEEKLGLKIQQEDMFLIGGSRGGMQMFLVLSRFPELQEKFAKVVSLSGLLDVRYCINDRADMRQVFIDDFGLIPNVNENEWIDYRDPMISVNNIRKELPILIIQGTKDIRIPLEVGYRMIEKLKKNGNDVTYWELEGNHCLTNRIDRMEKILEWLRR